MFSNNPFNMHRAIDQVLNEDPAHYAAIARNNAAKQAERDKTDGGKDKARRDKAKANLAKAKPVYAKGDKSFASNIGVKESKFLIPEEIPANERTAFHGAAAGAAKDGKTSFSFAGKKYPVTMNKGIAKNIADQKESIGQTAGDHGYYHLQKAKELAKKDGHDYDKLPQYDRTHDKHKDHYDSRAKKESVKKEATHSTTYFTGHKHAAKAGMGVKVHSKGADGDHVTVSHADPKKLQKYVDNHLGGGKIKESMTFREKLMSIYEGDRAAHYKSATKPEEYDEKQKSSKGAMDMMKTLKSVEADGMKAAKDTADAIRKSAPGKKMRKGDQNKGDLNIKPSATPIKDPSAKIITAEEYGMFGKKISSSLLDTVNQVTNKE